MTIFSSKPVKIRKSHECWGCAREFKIGTKMEAVVSKDYGKIETAYWCRDCVSFLNTLDDWQKEDGFYKGGLLDYQEYNEKIKTS